MTAAETAPGITITEQPDGAAYLYASQDEGADGNAGLGIPAEQRVAVAAAILPFHNGPISQPDTTGNTVHVEPADPAFGGPCVDVLTEWEGRVFSLAPDAAEQLAAQLLDAADQARTLTADIEGAQDRACDVTAEPAPRREPTCMRYDADPFPTLPARADLEA